MEPIRGLSASDACAISASLAFIFEAQARFTARVTPYFHEEQHKKMGSKPEEALSAPWIVGQCDHTHHWCCQSRPCSSATPSQDSRSHCRDSASISGRECERMMGNWPLNTTAHCRDDCAAWCYSAVRSASCAYGGITLDRRLTFVVGLDRGRSTVAIDSRHDYILVSQVHAASKDFTFCKSVWSYLF
jgi:hypothetical protein